MMGQAGNISWVWLLLLRHWGPLALNCFSFPGKKSIPISKINTPEYSRGQFLPCGAHSPHNISALAPHGCFYHFAELAQKPPLAAENST